MMRFGLYIGLICRHQHLSGKNTELWHTQHSAVSRQVKKKTWLRSGLRSRGSVGICRLAAAAAAADGFLGPQGQYRCWQCRCRQCHLHGAAPDLLQTSRAGGLRIQTQHHPVSVPAGRRGLGKVQNCRQYPR